MIKAIVLTVTFVSAIFTMGFSQDKLTYSEVVQTDSVSKEELYNRARVWFANTYNSSKDVIQMEDREGGQIIGKAIIKYSPKVFMSSEQIKGNIKYSVQVFVKDGRYKYEITDFIHDPYGNQYGETNMGLITTDEECPSPKPMAKGWSNKVWKDIKEQIEVDVAPLIVSLKQGMTQKAETENENW